MSTPIRRQAIENLIANFEFQSDANGEQKRHAAHSIKSLRDQHREELQIEADEAAAAVRVSGFLNQRISGIHAQIGRYIYYDSTTSSDLGNLNSLKFWVYFLTGGSGQWPLSDTGAELDISDVTYIKQFEQISGLAWGSRNEYFTSDKSGSYENYSMHDCWATPIINRSSNPITFQTNELGSSYNSNSNFVIGMIELDETATMGVKYTNIHNYSSNNARSTAKKDFTVPKNSTVIYVSGVSGRLGEDEGDVNLFSYRHNADWRPMVDAGLEVDEAWLANFWSGRITNLPDLWGFHEGITNA